MKGTSFSSNLSYDARGAIGFTNHVMGEYSAMLPLKNAIAPGVDFVIAREVRASHTFRVKTSRDCRCSPLNGMEE